VLSETTSVVRQRPAVQRAVDGETAEQTFAQPPQLALSVCVSTQRPSQPVLPLGQMMFPPAPPAEPSLSLLPGAPATHAFTGEPASSLVARTPPAPPAEPSLPSFPGAPATPVFTGELASSLVAPTPPAPPIPTLAPPELPSCCPPTAPSGSTLGWRVLDEQPAAAIAATKKPRWHRIPELDITTAPFDQRIKIPPAHTVRQVQGPRATFATNRPEGEAALPQARYFHALRTADRVARLAPGPNARSAPTC